MTRIRGVPALVLVTAATAAAQMPAVAELSARLPAEAASTLLLPRGKAGADELDKALARIKAPAAGLWAEVLADLPNAAAVDPAGPAAILRHPVGTVEGAVRRVRVVRTVADADPLAGPKRTADGDRAIYAIADGRNLHGVRAAGGLYAIGESKADLDWFIGSRAGLPDRADAARMEALRSAAVAVRLRGNAGKPLRAVAVPALPREPAAQIVDWAEQIAGPLEAALVCVNFADSGLRAQAFLDFPADGDAARGLSRVGPPGVDPLAGTAMGEPALLLSVQLSPHAARAGAAEPVRRLVELVRREGGALEEGFDGKLAAALAEIVGSASALGVVIGLPGSRDAVVGVRGAVVPAAGADLRKALADAVEPINRLLSAALRPPAPPVVLRIASAAGRIGERPVDVLELAAEGDSAAAGIARSLVQGIFGPEGVKFHLVESGPAASPRLVFALSCDRPLLEKTVSGMPPAVPPAVAGRLAALPAKRHLTLLVSPGRLLFLGRRIRENALQLPEWKPTGFIAVAGLFSERSVRLDVDVPWEEAEAAGAWLLRP
jgi:hypothetical protein